jgi:hypothetical protein
LLLLTGAGLLACSSDEGPKGPGPIPLDGLRDELAGARCEYAVRCGLLPDKASCDTAQGDDPETLQLLADAAYGRVEYDPTAARTCVEATRTQSCSTLLSTKQAKESACAGMFKGTVKESGPCRLAKECAGTGVCDLSMCDNNASCCLGACQKAPDPVAIGGDCSMGKTCVDSAYCKKDDMAMTETCTARKGNGEDCEAVNACKDGLRCDTGGSNKCYVLSQHGAQCNAALKNGACVQSDDYCDSMTSKCTRLPGDGQPCAEGSKCLPYASCDNGTCKARPDLDEACMDGGPKCLGSLACSNMKCTGRDSTAVCAF